MVVSEAIEKMIAFYKGSIHDIDHFIKVWSYAKTIGELEGLDAHTQEVLELAAVIHDIACPLCREKYGKALGKLQEQEGPAAAEEMLQSFRSRRVPRWWPNSSRGCPSQRRMWSAYRGSRRTITPIRMWTGLTTEFCSKRIT